MSEVDASTLARIDEGMRHVLTSLDDIKKQLASVTEGHRDLDRRVINLEADLRHAREDLSREQERQKDGARRAEDKREEAGKALAAAQGHFAGLVEKQDERIRSVEHRLWMWAGGGTVAAGVLSFVVNHLVK
jgi:septation ring formation regulator EzrA